MGRNELHTKLKSHRPLLGTSSSHHYHLYYDYRHQWSWFYPVVTFFPLQTDWHWALGGKINYLLRSRFINFPQLIATIHTFLFPWLAALSGPKAVNSRPPTLWPGGLFWKGDSTVVAPVLGGPFVTYPKNSDPRPSIDHVSPICKRLEFFRNIPSPEEILVVHYDWRDSTARGTFRRVRGGPNIFATSSFWLGTPHKERWVGQGGAEQFVASEVMICDEPTIDRWTLLWFCLNYLRNVAAFRSGDELAEWFGPVGSIGKHC